MITYAPYFISSVVLVGMLYTLFSPSSGVVNALIRRFGGESITYLGIDSTKHWSRLETYGAKIVENIVQATSRDILMNALRNLRNYRIVGHVHDELIIECSPDVDLNVICKQMGRSPDWMPDILFRADGYETDFYKKD